MSLTDREKFICHIAVLGVLELVSKKKINLIKMGSATYEDLIKKISETRCRRLTREQIIELNDEIIEELLLGSALYKMFEIIK